MKQKRKAKAKKHGTAIYLIAGGSGFWSKVGITTNRENRLQAIRKDTDGGAEYVLPPVVVPFAYQCEQTIHALFAWCNVERDGSGGTEWFFNVSPVSGSAIAYALYYFDAMPEGWNLLWLALVFFNPIVWLDALLIILLYALFWVLLVVGAAALVLFRISS